MRTSVHPLRRTRLLLAAVVAVVASCANHQAQLQTSLTLLNAARDGFVAYDDTHQHDIVKDATSLEQGQTELEVYRKKREYVLRGFEVAYKSLAAAALKPTVDNLAVLAADILDLKNTVLGVGATWPSAPPTPTLPAPATATTPPPP